MNKMLLMLPDFLALTLKATHLADLFSQSYSSTSKIPHVGRHGRVKIHALNDGRWHMKFHRSRV